MRSQVGNCGGWGAGMEPTQLGARLEKAVGAGREMGTLSSLEN